MSEDRPSQSNNKKTWLEKVADAFIGEPRDREDLKAIIFEARENDIIDHEAFKIIDGAMSVSELHVRDIMVPRSHMVLLDSEKDLADILPVIVDSGHSRFPVTGDKNDEIIGVLIAKDLLKLAMETSFSLADMSQKWKSLFRPVNFVPESKRLNVLLNDFRLNRNHMAIVVDEYGGIAGLVTIEDVLEEIVGDIDDEHDSQETPNIRVLDDGKQAVDALTPIEEFNDFFGTELSDDEFDTIGGIVTHSFGRLPKRDETIQIGNLNFRVLNADDRRLKLMEVSDVS
ncbi:HlyC/CorC family transporter [Gynuella sp.]|uniref:HlyC/CorC family transporter n=1 Tax=Gynuella sp. TaxID=2969146 RepID=UPI003D0A1375